jgi:hypothetical protein
MNNLIPSILIIAVAFFGWGQNIINNGNFEVAGTSPGWVSIKSVDYFSSAVSNQEGTMGAQSGAQFCGIRSYSADMASDNWQEYIYQGIAGSMSQGLTYKVSFYYCLADMCTRTSDDFGLAFIEDPNFFNTPNDSYLLSLVTPQVRFPDGYFPTEDILWTKFTDYYTATGNEKFAVLGSFKTDATLDTIGITSDYWFNQGDVYLYIDNISVVPCADYPLIDLEEKITLCESGDVTLDAYFPGAAYLWSTGDTSSALTTNISNAQYISVELTRNGCSYKDSTYFQVFSASENYPDTILCSHNELPLLYNVNLNQDEMILWDDLSINPARLINAGGEYHFTKLLDECKWVDTFEVIVFEENALVYPNPGINEIHFRPDENVNVLSILTGEGKLVWDEIHSSSDIQMIIRNLNPGVYFILLERDGCLATVKYEKIELK